MWSELIMFLKNIDTKLTVFENINTLYYIVNFNPTSLYCHMYIILQKYYNNYTYDVARDGSWVKINDIKYNFDNTKSLIVS